MRTVHCGLLLVGCVSLWGRGNLSGATPTDQLEITSIAVDGTNVIFDAAVPRNVEQVALEMSPALGVTWTEVGRLDVPAGAGEVFFTIPKPATETAFFQLEATLATNAAAPVSGVVEYVAIPALEADPAAGGDAVLHFKAMVDGSDKIIITHDGAMWHHLDWDWPGGEVTVNGMKWKPEERNYLTTGTASKLVPDRFSLKSARLERIGGRDVIAMERAGDALIVYVDDTLPGLSPYDFKIHFPMAGTEPAKPAVGAPGRLKIAARIDGSDCLKITPTGATWEHKAWGWPTQVSLNGVPWSPQASGVLKNGGTNQFLPPGIELSSARIVQRKGRDLATMWADKGVLWIWFADNPNGSDLYELEISFGP